MDTAKDCDARRTEATMGRGEERRSLWTGKKERVVRQGRSKGRKDDTRRA